MIDFIRRDEINIKERMYHHGILLQFFGMQILHNTLVPIRVYINFSDLKIELWKIKRPSYSLVARWVIEKILEVEGERNVEVNQKKVAKVK
ncbi:unnamed protein product [Rhizophagus irregularis]|uniref:Uncharacterized protein n=1 Tax=Rhizophagus irregularis TaxID=588596 RepID=A0A916EA69_9GLOM|nr:unnamed protein product [Rhizophagus irregularis]CAB5371520.1 unnamed protein product [Rhizophagus irregularis]